MDNFDFDQTKRAVIQVRGGRGFVVAAGEYRYVVTAAHCLPRFPPCATYAESKETTYKSLLGKLKTKPAVWANCLFADPIGDIAVLGEPDGDELYERRVAYNALFADVNPLTVSEVPPEGAAWVLSLEGQWSKYQMTRLEIGPLSISGVIIHAGMSGSPILADDGSAIGVLSAGSTNEAGDAIEVYGNGHAQTSLVENLPGWMLRKLGALEARQRGVDD